MSTEEDETADDMRTRHSLVSVASHYTSHSVARSDRSMVSMYPSEFGDPSQDGGVAPTGPYQTNRGIQEAIEKNMSFYVFPKITIVQGEGGPTSGRKSARGALPKDTLLDDMDSEMKRVS